MLKENLSILLSSLKDDLEFLSLVYQSMKKLTVRRVQTNRLNLRLFDDSQLFGGTKERLLEPVLRSLPYNEFVYAAPDTGFAQLAIANVCKRLRKKAIIFVNTASVYTGELTVLSQATKCLGAKMKLPEKGMYQTLRTAQARAERYVKDHPNAYLLPFGLHFNIDSKERDQMIHIFKDLLKNIKPPKRLWIASGSGTLVSLLEEIWPNTIFLMVQVGKTPKTPLHAEFEVFVSPEQFDQETSILPPYKSVNWYDAKVWQFVKEKGKSGDAIWNVGGTPSLKQLEYICNKN